MAGNTPVLGSRKCIEGKQYEYSPPTPEVAAMQGAQQQQATTDTGLLAQIGQMLQVIGSIIAGEGTYQGMYRSSVIVVPANYQNYAIPIGFQVRRFYFDTPLQVILRLSTPSSDPIVVNPGYGSMYNLGMGLRAPVVWKKIPHGLAFSTIYVTNPYTTADVNVYIYAMG